MLTAMTVRVYNAKTRIKQCWLQWLLEFVSLSRLGRERSIRREAPKGRDPPKGGEVPETGATGGVSESIRCWDYTVFKLYKRILSLYKSSPPTAYHCVSNYTSIFWAYINAFWIWLAWSDILPYWLSGLLWACKVLEWFDCVALTTDKSQYS